jgi:hypothetical protein
MCNWVLKNNQEKPFRLFVYLKLFYPNGKIKWNNDDIALAALALYNTERTIRNNFKKLKDFNWIFYDEEYKYWRINSFDKIRYDNFWEFRRAYCFRYKDLFQIYATLGAVLYTQLYKAWIKKYMKGRSNVRIKRRADKPPTHSYKKRYAQISVLFINRFYGISICKAVKLKQLAQKAGLIEVRKQYNELPIEWIHVFKKGKEYRDETPNIIFRNGKYYEQLIDRIYSEMYFKKRKKLETL